MEIFEYEIFKINFLYFSEQNFFNNELLEITISHLHI